VRTFFGFGCWPLVVVASVALLLGVLGWSCFGCCGGGWWSGGGWWLAWWVVVVVGCWWGVLLCCVVVVFRFGVVLVVVGLLVVVVVVVGCGWCVVRWVVGVGPTLVCRKGGRRRPRSKKEARGRWGWGRAARPHSQSGFSDDPLHGGVGIVGGSYFNHTATHYPPLRFVS
jgi:hypothetical protein